MIDFIQINKKVISAQLSVSFESIDDLSYIGHIDSLDIPFSSPSKEKVVEISSGLVNALFIKWLKLGGVNYLIEKLKEYKIKYSFDYIEFDINNLIEINIKINK